MARNFVLVCSLFQKLFKVQTGSIVFTGFNMVFLTNLMKLKVITIRASVLFYETRFEAMDIYVNKDGDEIDEDVNDENDIHNIAIDDNENIDDNDDSGELGGD